MMKEIEEDVLNYNLDAWYSVYLCDYGWKQSKKILKDLINKAIDKAVEIKDKKESDYKHAYNRLKALRSASMKTKEPINVWAEIDEIIEEVEG